MIRVSWVARCHGRWTRKRRGMPVTEYEAMLRMVAAGRIDSGRGLLVEFDAQARGARRDDVALLPADRHLQDLGVEAAPGPDALLNQEVGRAGADLDMGGAFDGAAVEVRGDLGVVGLGQNIGGCPRFP